MHLQSKIWVDQNIERVTGFFYDPASLPKWDRSVSEMIPTSQTSDSVGSTFDTIAPSGLKMSYKIIEFESSKRSVKILLTHSKMFKRAIWHFHFDPEKNGTQISCHIYFTPRFQYFFLYPVLYVNKNALLRDLNFLKVSLNKN
jgi:hypothetical protein